jgi:hypothetical protein
MKFIKVKALFKLNEEVGYTDLLINKELIERVEKMVVDEGDVKKEENCLVFLANKNYPIIVNQSFDSFVENLFIFV